MNQLSLTTWLILALIVGVLWGMAAEFLAVTYFAVPLAGDRWLTGTNVGLLVCLIAFIMCFAFGCYLHMNPRR